MSMMRVNGNIRAPEVSVIEEQGQQLGIMCLSEALSIAKSRSLDLIETEPDAKPPICQIMDFGKFRYEQAKRHRK